LKFAKSAADWYKHERQVLVVLVLVLVLVDAPFQVWAPDIPLVPLHLIDATQTTHTNILSTSFRLASKYVLTCTAHLSIVLLRLALHALLF
jgi:hypothetical protein